MRPLAITLLLLLFPASPTVGAEAATPAEARPPESIDPTDQRRILARITQRLSPPAPESDPAALQQALDELVADAAELTVIVEPGPLQQLALNVQLQGLYLRITHWPDEPENDALLSYMRGAARQMRALPDRETQALADFWLLTCDLVDINRSGLSMWERREQARPLLENYLESHPEGPGSEAIRERLANLDAPSTPAETPPTPPAEPAEGERELSRPPMIETEIEIETAPPEPQAGTGSDDETGT